MRILGQPRGAVHRERLERIRCAAGTDTRLPIAGEMGADGLTVPAQMAGDRGDRPTPGIQGVRVDVFLPCEHGDVGLLRAGVWSETTSLEGAPPVSAEPRGWGISVSNSGENHLSAVTAAVKRQGGCRQCGAPVGAGP